MWECEYWNDELNENAFFWGHSIREADEKAKETLSEKGWYRVDAEYID